MQGLHLLHAHICSGSFHNGIHMCIVCTPSLHVYLYSAHTGTVIIPPLHAHLHCTTTVLHAHLHCTYNCTPCIPAHCPQLYHMHSCIVSTTAPHAHIHCIHNYTSCTVPKTALREYLQCPQLHCMHTCIVPTTALCTYFHGIHICIMSTPVLYTYLHCGHTWPVSPHTLFPYLLHPWSSITPGFAKEMHKVTATLELFLMFLR